MKKKELSRRDFLKITGAVTVVTIPILTGYGLLKAAEGESPPQFDPYSEDGINNIVNSGVPILVLVNQSSNNSFGGYLGEILRAEGLNCFQMIDLSMASSDLLAQYDIVLLAEGVLNTSQVELMEGYVFKGGRLVVMRPEASLGTLLGVERISGSIIEGYLQTETDHEIVNGIVSESLQFHGEADQYRLAGAQVIAWLDQGREVSKRYPAVTLNDFGEGQTSMWAFDLAKSVAYTRQGNPEWANQERDGHPYIRACDMFKDWIDLDRIGIPQADEHQRLLSKVITYMSQDTKPLPRLWYFPGSVDAILVATGDAHPISSATAIDNTLKRVEERGGHMSIYYSFTLNNRYYNAARKARFWASDLPVVGESLRNRYISPTPRQVDEWRSRGHEFTLHPHVGEQICGGFHTDGFIDFPSTEAGWQRYWQEFTALGYEPISPTVRTHCVLWDGWVESARLQSSYGMRMNMDYYHVGPAFRNGNGEWVFGHFTGSGLPMKFVDGQGRVLDIYQQLTQLADEHFFSFPEMNWVNVADYSPEAALEVSQGLLHASLETPAPAAISVNFHTDPFAYGGRPADIAGRWLDGTLDFAAFRGIPIWSALDWLNFTQARHDAEFTSIQWNPENLHLVFDFTAPLVLGVELAAMLPSRHGDSKLIQIEVDGVPQNSLEKKVHGTPHQWVTVQSGAHQIVAKYS